MRVIVKHSYTVPPTAEDIINDLLADRNITDRQAFFHPLPPTEWTLEAWGFTKEKDTLLTTLERCKKEHLPIVVYMDYDADGITGGTIMWETLHFLGFTVHPYIPSRTKEGYGFSKIGIDHVLDTYHPGLIITVDHGIAGAEHVAYLQEKGVPVIITDHHNKGSVEPQSITTFHIPALSGSGVSYLVAQEIFRHFANSLDSTQSAQEQRERLEYRFANDYLSLAATGAVADLIPLTGKARDLVYHGLQVYSKAEKPGLQALMEVAGIKTTPITTIDIGYRIAPRINAVGRIGDATNALRLLCTTKKERALAFAQAVNETNGERQAVTQIMLEEALHMVEHDYGNDLPHCILLFNPSWHEGVVGLIAGKIMDIYHRPTIILTASEEDPTKVKGSGRSIPGFHMTNFLQGHKDMLISAGGHELASGLMLERNKLLEFKTLFESHLLENNILEKTLHVDIEGPLRMYTETLFEALQSLAPFGMGNREPSIIVTGTIVGKRIMGKAGTVCKYLLKDTTETMPVVFFGNHETQEQGDIVHVVGTLQKNVWQGTVEMQIVGKYIEKTTS